MNTRACELTKFTTRTPKSTIHQRVGFHKQNIKIVHFSQGTYTCTYCTIHTFEEVLKKNKLDTEQNKNYFVVTIIVLQVLRAQVHLPVGEEDKGIWRRSPSQTLGTSQHLGHSIHQGHHDQHRLHGLHVMTNSSYIHNFVFIIIIRGFYILFLKLYPPHPRIKTIFRESEATCRY